MNKKTAAIILIILFFTLVSSGCLDFFTDTSTTYQAYPTKITYNIRYGYNLYCTGVRGYEIHYNCYKPEILLGSITHLKLLYNESYTLTQLANNDIVFWNVSGNSNQNYTLGISADVQVESFLVPDLSGKNALTIQEIKQLYPDIVKQYCHKQSNGTTVFIDPSYPDIKTTATLIKNQSQTNNSFIIAKSLFSWLKENTDYQIHGGESAVQSSSKTYQLKTGDCDDLSFLYISLCRSVGIPARFIRGYLISENNGAITLGPHAWAEVFVGGSIGNNGWIPVECAGSASSIQTEIHQNFGVENIEHLRLFIDDGSNESINLSMSAISWTYSGDGEITANSFTELNDYIVLEEKQLVVTEEGARSYI